MPVIHLSRVNQLSFIYKIESMNLERTEKEIPVYRIIRQYLFYTGVVLMSLLATTAFGQTKRTLTGVVISATDGEPIPGTNIVVKGTTEGGITDIDGKYSIQVNEGDVLVVSFIGFKTQLITVTNQTVLDITLEEEISEFDEVVVVGYGSMKKSDISGSVVSVDTEEMMKKNPLNLSQGLQGSAAGVMVSKQSGDPEGKTTIRIRGIGTINNSADPLYVVDGVQVGTSANFINPTDVESIEVLKDASATAIYGARGANGVILITTKKGTQGQTRINATANFGVQSLTGKLDVADAEKFAESVRIGRANDGASITNDAFSESYIGQLRNIDWQEAMTRMAVQQNYTISASGGNDKTQSNFSLGYLENEGIVIESDYTRLTARANVMHKVKDFVEIGGSVSFEHSEKVGDGNLRDYAILTPTMDYVDGDGNFISHDYDEQTEDGEYYAFKQTTGEGDIAKGQDNPYALAKEADHTPAYNNTLLGTAYLDIDIVKGLSFKTVLSYKYSAYDGSAFSIANTRSITASGVNSFWLSQSQNNETGIESYFTYNLNKDAHNLTLMAGHSVTNYWGHWVGASATEFVSDAYRDISYSNSGVGTGTGGYSLTDRFISYFGRASYSYKDKYIFTGTLRKDGSNNFGEDNLWGTFPSAALAWRLSEEDFIKNLGFISNLKLRLGWGVTGNAGGATTKAVEQLSSYRIGYYMGSLNGSNVTGENTYYPGITQLSEYDTSLKWEENEQTNIGVDLGINGNLNLTVDYFVRDTKALLLEKSIRPSSGHSSVYTNDGHIRNKGFELSLAYNKTFGDWNLGVVATGSTIKNEIISISNPIFDRIGGDGETNTDDGDDWNTHQAAVEGYAVGSYYGYVVEGIWQSQTEIDAANTAASTQSSGEVSEYQNFGGSPQPGDYKYKDLDGNGYIDGDDQKVLGNGFPKLNYGITINAGYKNFDAMVYMYGVSGMKINSYAAMKLSQLYKTGGGIQNTLNEYLDNAWSETNTDGKYARLTVVDNNKNRQASSIYVKDGNFLRCANIQFGYTLPRNLIQKIKLEKARVYISAENVFTVTNYEYGDPEVGNSGVRETGFDKGRYPYPRTFSAGLQLQF